MFEGQDDDFSFLDDDFLQEVFHPGDSDNKKESVAQQENSELIQDSIAENSVGCINNSSNKTALCVGTKVATLKSNSTSKCIANKASSGVQYSKDDSFEFEDDIPFHLLDASENVNPETQVLSTPPDSAITCFSSAESFQAANSDIHGRTNSTPKKLGFRSRILQTLKESQCLSDQHTTTSHNASHFISPLSDSFSSSGMSTPIHSKQKRKVPVDFENGCDGDYSESSKSPYQRLKSVPNNQEGFSSQASSSVVENRNVRDDVNKYPVRNKDWTKHSIETKNASWKEGHGASHVTPLKSVPSVDRRKSPGGPLIQKRKFPGPAGILPQMGSRNTTPSVQQIQNEDSPPPVNQDVLCSQASVDDFSRGPWKEMLKDLEMSESDPASPLQVFNIKWVLRRASLKGQASVRKVPFLAATVRSLDVTHLDATIVLKDRTGDINGTVASSVIDEYGSTLQPGSVLVLRNVTVLSPVGLTTTGVRDHTRRHYLNISLNTVLTIYSQEDSEDVIITSIAKVDRAAICKEAAAPKMAAGPRTVIEEEEEEILKEESVQNQSLFSVNRSFNNSSCNNNTNWKSPSVTKSTGSMFSASCPAKAPPLNPVQSSFRNPHPSRGGSNSQFIARPKTSSPSICFSPSPGTTIRHQRPPLLAPNNHRFQFSRSVSSPSGHEKTSVKPSEMMKIVTASPQIFSSQAEEEEVTDILEGIDTDSLFGDF